MKAFNDILAEAQRLAEGSKTWADLSNALFDPMDGLVAKLLPAAKERAAFRETEQYRQLRALVEEKMRETGISSGAEPTKSGRFVVRLPRTLHAALEHEAEAEGTSLNQLVLAKLAARLATLATGGISSLVQAFCEVRDGYSADRVVADPELDRKFLHRCRELGLSGTDYDLNWKLLNARKAGQLSELPRTKRYTVNESDAFEYASELAIRHLNLIKGVSLDRIICDPCLAKEFDNLAERLAPGYKPLEYRWLALGLRKAGRLQEGVAAQAKVPRLELVSSVSKLQVSALPQAGGLYLFSSQGKPVYLSQTENLRQRLERHMDVSRSLGLPDWLWHEGPLDLSLTEAPGLLRASRQKAEILLIKQLRPILNYQRAA
ncbi:MAG: GIY-YIG nuclease family protein [Planctomycetia bacterium]|nr:GIY-YIG nuclease family protein [Planctomycetia bacterium]